MRIKLNSCLTVSTTSTYRYPLTACTGRIRICGHIKQRTRTSVQAPEHRACSRIRVSRHTHAGVCGHTIRSAVSLAVTAVTTAESSAIDGQTKRGATALESRNPTLDRRSCYQHTFITLYTCNKTVKTNCHDCCNKGDTGGRK